VERDALVGRGADLHTAALPTRASPAIRLRITVTRPSMYRIARLARAPAASQMRLNAHAIKKDRGCVSRRGHFVAVFNIGGSGVVTSIQTPSRRERRLHGACPALAQPCGKRRGCRQNVSQS
jgi:hypothetical protein